MTTNSEQISNYFTILADEAQRGAQAQYESLLRIIQNHEGEITEHIATCIVQTATALAQAASRAQAVRNTATAMKEAIK